MAKAGKKRRNRLKRKRAYRPPQEAADARRVIDNEQDRKNALRASYAISVAIRAGMFGLSQDEAHSQEGGSVLGRAWINREITLDQFHTGKTLSELLYEWINRKGLPSPTPAAMDLNMVAGFSRNDEDIDKMHRLDSLVTEARDSVTGKEWEELTNVCWLDNPIGDLELFTDGLNKLTGN